MNATREQRIADARAIIARVKSEKRTITAEEKGVIDALLLDEEIRRMSQAMGSSATAGITDGGGGLYAAMRTSGYDRREHPAAVVPFGTFGATASFDGNYEDAMPSFKTAPPLGADARFLFPELPFQAVDADETSVQSFRQKSRTLPTLSNAIRDIDAVTDKPEVATVTELLNEPLHQIAMVETDIPNVMLESVAFRGWIDDDLRFGYRSAVDAHVIAQILAATIPTAAFGLNLLETFAAAANIVRAAGFEPNVLAASAQDLLTLSLLKEPTAGSYVAQKMDFILAGLERVVVPALHASGLAYVLDSRAAGTLYSSPVRVASFEQDAGKTNSSTVRIESNGVFIVQRTGAICEVAVGS